MAATQSPKKTKATHASSSSSKRPAPARATSAKGSGASKNPLFSPAGGRSLGRVVSKPKNDIFGWRLDGDRVDRGDGKIYHGILVVG